MGNIINPIEVNSLDESSNVVQFIFNDGNLDLKPCFPSRLGALIPYPSHPAIVERILPHEWEDFSLALRYAIHEASLPMGWCLIPGVAQLSVLLCNYTHMYCIDDRARKLNAVYNIFAKFNKYLFYPRGMLIRLRSSQVRDECGSSYAHYIRINIATPATPKGIDTTVESPIISGGVSRRGKRVLFEAQSRASTGYDFYPKTYPGATVCCGVDWVSPIKHQIDFMKVEDCDLDEKYSAANTQFQSAEPFNPNCVTSAQRQPPEATLLQPSIQRIQGDSPDDVTVAAVSISQQYMNSEDNGGYITEAEASLVQPRRTSLHQSSYRVGQGYFFLDKNSSLDP